MLSIVNYDASDSEASDCDEKSATAESIVLNGKPSQVTEEIGSKAEISRPEKRVSSELVKLDSTPNFENGDINTNLDADDSITTFTNLNFSTAVSDMLSGLPPPKKKRVKATESVFNEIAIPKKLTTLLGKSAKDKIESKSKLNVSISTTDSDDSDEEQATPKESSNKWQKAASEKVVLHKDGDDPEGKQFSNPLLCSLPKARTSFDLKKTQMMVPDSVKNKQKISGTKFPKIANNTKSSATKHETGYTFPDSLSSTQTDGDTVESDAVSYFNLSGNDSSESSSLSNSFYSSSCTQSVYDQSNVGSFDDEVYPDDESASYAYAYDNSSQISTMATATTSSNLDADVLHRLQGRRKENIEIVDVNAQDQLEDVSIQVTKGISEEPEFPGGLGQLGGRQQDKVDPEQRRAKSKHQLNWLVTQAKAREVQLKNQWADNRMNRRATQMKYGF